MSLIRLRKKNLLKAGLIGGLCTAIPLGITIFAILFYYPSEWGENSNKNSGGKGSLVPVCQIIRDIKADELIREKDLKVIYLSEEYTQPELSVKAELVGKRIKLSVKEKTMITKDMVYLGEILPADLRIHNYNFIQLTDKLRRGDYIDVRISFANGADFIILSKKKVEDLTIQNETEGTTNSLWLKVTEEEILRLSSAVVDAYISEGCVIYAIKYVQEIQESATANYPVNEVVEKLIEEDPNIIARAKDVMSSKHREELSVLEDIRDSQNSSVDKPMYTEEDNAVADSYNSDEIEYFD